MTFAEDCKKYLESKGHEYLGMEDDYVFYKDENGKVFGAGEDMMARHLHDAGICEIDLYRRNTIGEGDKHD